MRAVWGCCAVMMTLAAPAHGQAADDLVAALLEQVGGRDLWATATGFHMVEILEDAGLPLPAVREYWVDFAQPRIMERTVANSMVQLQALNVSEGWVVRDGQHSAWTTDRVSAWRGFWPGIPTRVFHLLASEDPSVSVELRAGERLDVFVDGEFAVWIALSDDGVPVAYGREESHAATHFLGGLEQYGDVRLWAAAYEPGDTWQVTMVDYDLFHDDLPVSFDVPTSPATHRPDGVGGGR